MEVLRDPDPPQCHDACSRNEEDVNARSVPSELTVPNCTVTSGDNALNGNDSDIHGPGSSCDSHTHPETSTAPSLTCLSLEERLRRMRAAEELKQQQRMAAYLESQRQAELSRLKAQEDRKRKLEELHQRAEARRQLVLERRKELERTNKAKMEMLRDRSGTRHLEGRRHTDHYSSLGRTASASPSLDTARNPNRLMTTSCVVAFGSSAPRSMCTQPSPAVLRLQQAFEARITSYLTGRHSGCYLTPSASPQILRLIPSERLSVTPSTVAFLQHHVAKSKRCHRRAMSAHASLLQHTKSSLARSHHTKHVPEPSVTNVPAKIHSEAGARSAKQVTLAVVTGPDSSSTKDAVTYDRSNSSYDCHTLGRPRTALGMPSSGRSVKLASGTATGTSSAPHSATASVASSSAGSQRSNSVDALAKRAQASHVPSVFERLAATGTGRNRPATADSSDAKPKFAVPTKAMKKVVANGLPPPTKHPLVPSSRTLPKGMSASVHVDRKAVTAKHPHEILRKRSVSPKPSSTLQPLENAPNDTTSVSTVPPESTVTSVANHDTVVSERTSVADAIVPNVTVPESEVNLVDAPASSVHSDAVAPVVSSDLSNQTPELNADTAPTPMLSIPLKAETRGAGEGALLSENEAAIYRAKLFEQRRLAKERKEQEQRRLEEEQRRRWSQLEAEKLAAERAALEQAERLAQAEAETQRIREEEEKAQLRALEAERLAKLQRAEEERIMRKKRLDSIMSRVKSSAGNGKSSDPLLTNVSSAPLLQECANGEANTPVIGGDVSNPPHEFTESEGVEHPPAAPEPIIGTEDHTVSCTSERLNDTPSSFNLPVERNDVPNGSSNLDVDPTRSDFANCNGADNKTPSATDLFPRSPHQQPSPTRPISVPTSPVKSLLSGSANPAIQTSVDGNSTVPRFKSALLQSMLGGGRLATHAKDAVVGLRSRGSSSQLLDCVSKTDDESGMNSPPQWTRLNPSGDSEANLDLLHSGSPNRAEPMSCGRQADLTRSSPMVQSMFEGPVDKFRVNCSNDPPRPIGSPILPLAQHQD